MFRQGQGQFMHFVIVFSLVLVHIQAISNLESNIQNAITEEERRGADSTNANHNANDVNAAKKNAKIILEDNGDKKTRGIHAIHSPSASFKTTQYFMPSAYDSHIAASGHGGSSHSGGGGGHSGGGYSIGSTSGYDYVGGGGGHGGGHGSTAPTSGSNLGLSHHGHIHHHNGPTGYAPSATGFGGFGLSHGGYNHGGGGGSGVHVGGHLAGQHGQHGQLFGGNAAGHSAGGGIHNALALKGLLIPLAGIALLGAAAALSTNPVLLQLGVVNGRRRRRSIGNEEDAHYPANPHVQPVSNY